MATRIVAACAAFPNPAKRPSRSLRFSAEMTMAEAETAINERDGFALQRAVTLATLAQDEQQLLDRYRTQGPGSLETASQWVEVYRQHLARLLAQSEAAATRLRAVAAAARPA